MSMSADVAVQNMLPFVIVARFSPVSTVHAYQHRLCHPVMRLLFRSTASVHVLARNGFGRTWGKIKLSGITGRYSEMD